MEAGSSDYYSRDGYANGWLRCNAYAMVKRRISRMCSARERT
jgi:hypothetical protein